MAWHPPRKALRIPRAAFAGLFLFGTGGAAPAVAQSDPLHDPAAPPAVTADASSAKIDGSKSNAASDAVSVKRVAAPPADPADAAPPPAAAAVAAAPEPAPTAPPPSETAPADTASAGSPPAGPSPQEAAPPSSAATVDAPTPKDTDWVDTTPSAAAAPAQTAAATTSPAAPAEPEGPSPAALDALLPQPQVPSIADPLAPPPGTQATAPPPQGPNFADLPAPLPAFRVTNPSLRDTATLVVDGKDLALYGIEGRSGEDAAVLQNYITGAGGQLECKPEDADRHVCTLPDGTDIAKVALVNGIASYALGGPQAYRDEEEDAQKARRGLWADLPPLPPQIDHPTLPDTATLRSLAGDAYKLDGIEGMSGPMAATLQGYIAANGDSIQCQPQGPSTDVCVLRDGTDIAKVALVNGLAKASSDASTEYRIEQDAAKANRRGVWATLSSDAAASAGQEMTRLQAVVATVDVAEDGYVLVDGQPTLLVEGAPVFMVFAGAAGWGYWDHGQRWHGAPDRFAHRLESLHPRGEGLRGWSNQGVRQAMVSARPGEFGRGVPVSSWRGGSSPIGAMRPGGGMGMGAMRPGVGGPMAGGMRAPISSAGFARPAFAGGGVGGMRPGMGGAATGMRAGMNAPAIGMRPGMGAPAVGGMRPGMAMGGGMRPGYGAPAMGGMRPGGMAMAPRPVAAAPRPAAPARGGRRGGGRRGNAGVCKAAVADVVGAFGWADACKQLADFRPWRLHGSNRGRSLFGRPDVPAGAEPSPSPTRKT